MWNRGARSSALERAQAHLSGRRLVNTGAEPEDTRRPGSSLDGLGRSALQTKHASFLDLSDLSSEGTQSPDSIRPAGASRLRKQDLSSPPPAPGSSGAGAGGGSRFLKRAAPAAAASSLSPALSRTQTQHPESRYAASSQWSTQSTALNRLALIEDRIRNRQQARDKPPSSAPNRGSSPGSAAQETPRSLSAQSISEPSVKSRRFLKTKTPTTAAATLVTAPAVAPKGPGTSFKAATPLGGSKASPVAVANRGVTLDSDEEDMRRLLGGSFDMPEDSLLTDLRGASQNIEHSRKPFKKTPKMSPSPPSGGRASSARRLPRSTPSPLRGSPLRVHRPSPLPRSPEGPSPGQTGSLGSRPLRRSFSSASDRSEVRSLEELFPVALGSLAELRPEALGSLAELRPGALDSDDAISEQSGMSDDFKIKVLSLDDLAPVTLGDAERPEKKKTEPRVSERRGVVSPRVPEEEPSEEAREEEPQDYESDFESEARTEGGVSDISEHLGDEEKEETSEGDGFEQSRVSDKDNSRYHGRYDDYSNSLSERRSRPRSRSFDGQDSRTDNESQSGSPFGRTSRSPSSSASSSRTVTPPRRSEAPPSGPAVKETATQTQPDGLTYAWSPGFASLGPSVGTTYMDPTPVARHTVSAEALCSSSPAVFALNDMLRQQLSLTRHFVQTSRCLHSSLLRSLEPADYAYTTLEDAKEFIRCHQPPRLTLEEALEDVLQEMRDYHYI